jgi:tetratricopeptide (TPR) repeat protein
LFYYKTITKIKDSEAISKSFNFFDTKSTEALLKNDSIKAAYYLELISLGQFKMGFYHDSESTTIEAFKLLDDIKINPKTIAPRERLSNQLGMIYRKIGDFDNSLRFYKQALKLNKNILDKIAIETNIANIYADQNEYSKAIASLNKFYKEALTLGKSSIKATYFDNLGFFQSKINDPMAIKNMKLALKIRLDIKDLIGTFLSYQHMSSYFLEKGNRAKALEYSNKVQVISNLIKSPVYIKEALKLNLKLENNPNFEKYIELNDSLENIKQLRENKFAAIKYNVAEKERIINQRELMLKTSELQKEKQKKLKLIYLFSGLSIY